MKNDSTVQESIGEALDLKMGNGTPRHQHGGAEAPRKLNAGTLRTLDRLRTLYGLSWSDRLLVLEAVVYLGLARLLLFAVPFRRIAPHLGQRMAETRHDADPSMAYESQRVGRVVRRLVPYTPWDSKCLAQAMAARLMLQRRGIPTTLYLGVAKDGDSALLAHAWLRCGPHLVTGGAGHERYTVICTFGVHDF